jgi:hypothetical protein
MNVGTQTVPSVSKAIRKRALPKYKGRYLKLNRVKQSTRSTQLSINPFQSVDLVKFVKQRRTVAFDTSFTTDTLLNIFEKVRF